LHTHDPQKVIEELRDNLASHDRQTYFLFGAGTSSSINIAPEPKPGEKKQYIQLIPSIIPLTEMCLKSVVNLGIEYKTAWELLEKQCDEKRKVKNIENILSLVRTKIDAIGSNEKLLGLDRKGLNKLEGEIRSSIAKVVNPGEDKIPNKIPHNYFASWLKKVTRVQPIEIFTTNYDLLIERSLEFEQIPFFDGFVGCSEPFFYLNSLEDEDFMPSNKWIRLWKIHGSVNWKIKKNIDSKDVIIRVGASESGEMILPSHRKYDESRKQPYSAILDRLSKVLNKDHSLLITCGYSFGDQHINSVIFSALENRSSAHVISLQYQDLEIDSDLIRWATKRDNFAILGANAAIVGGKFGDWKLLGAVDAKTCGFMDVAFDSNASIDNDDKALSGKLRLGDFNWFCKFLMSMERKVGE